MKFIVRSKALITKDDKNFPYYVSTVTPQNLDTWKQIPKALGYSSLSQYILYLKTTFGNTVDIRVNPTPIPNRITGLKISFAFQADAQILSNQLNGGAV